MLHHRVRTRTLVGLLLLASFCCLNSGCLMSGWANRPNWSMMRHSAKIPAEASKEEIVAYVNRQITPIKSWRATSADVWMDKMLVKLSGKIAVEQPQLLRITVGHSMVGNEVELGSNPDHLWFWAKRMEPAQVVAVGHEDLSQVQNQLPLPVQPEWLMEVLSVKAVDATNAKLLQDPENPRLAKLVTHHTNAYGQMIRKIVVIDLHAGEVREHQLFDAQHKLLACATLTDYRSFPKTDAKLPYDIELKWYPPEGKDIKLHFALRSVEINSPMPSEMWDIPQIAGCPVNEIGKEQLLQSPSRTMVAEQQQSQQKPRAITEYAQQNGQWSHQQRIEMPAGTASIATLHASHEQPSHEQPSQAQTSTAGNSPFFEQPPVPAHSASQPQAIEATESDSSDIPVWARQPADSPAKKSRSSLTTGVAPTATGPQ